MEPVLTTSDPSASRVAADTFRATVEGTFVKGLSKRERRKVLTFALERLMTA